ncbi:hypothetical protein [Novosphingobium sp. ZW T3_23]|uniref:hypothetical protein n=1 Tax=Novosphingobium sp. ZW T3_23 TaxID=3378084 RepID=UPI003853D519
MKGFYMEFDHLHALMAALVIGLTMVGASILADEIASRPLRRGMAVIGFCMILASIAIL